MEYPNITLNFETYIELFTAYKELNQIKNLIEDNMGLDLAEEELELKNVYEFGKDLLKLIKYTDVKFYEDLKKYFEGKTTRAEQ